jgi:phage/plasmid-like protein (TIGR03299 family)
MAPLGAVGTRYTPFQNRDAFAWMDDVVGESLAIWHTAGSLRGGRTVWMLCKLPEVVEVSDRDLMDQYVLVTNHHDGLGSVRLFPTTVRVVCANTLRLATSRGLDVGLKLRHTVGSLADRVRSAKECLGVIRNAQGEFITDARRMQAAGLDSAGVQDYFDGLAATRPSEKAREKLVSSLWERFHLPTNEAGFGANVWTAYNAASEFADHSMRVIGSGEQRMERRFSSALFGAAHEFKDRAWRAALELAC